MPPTTTVTGVAVCATPVVISPALKGGVVGPKPVAYITMTSPGLAGAAPPPTDGSATIAEPLPVVAATFLPSNVKNAGAYACCVVTLNGSLLNSLGAPGLAITTTDACPTP